MFFPASPLISGVPTRILQQGAQIPAPPRNDCSVEYGPFMVSPRNIGFGISCQQP